MKGHVIVALTLTRSFVPSNTAIGTNISMSSIRIKKKSLQNTWADVLTQIAGLSQRAVGLIFNSRKALLVWKFS